MKRLTLLRHGHAEARAEDGDFHRALDARGRDEVARSTTMILESFAPPDVLLVSAAQRTRQTAEVFRQIAAAAGVTPRVIIEQRLYHASWQETMELAQGVAADVAHLLVIGHNPGLSELAARFAVAQDGPGRFAGLTTGGWYSALLDGSDDEPITP